ncbi:MAG: hypothetical protein Q9169_001908 [Polycauliona sp. 2 TL-2023]
MASISDDELEYLAPSFDPATLTVPKLRSVLLAHDVTYLASAKKPQLIQLFNEELKPRSRKILAARSRIRRSSKGITNMLSSQESTVNGDDDASMLPPPIPEPSRRKPRKSSRQPSEDPVSEQLSRKNSTKHSRPSDTDADESDIQRPSVRKTRKSEVQPPLKPREPEATPLRPALEKSPFSDENPFQSGSSPLAPGDQRRKSSGPSANRRKSSSRRRKTEGIASAQADPFPQRGGFIVPSSETFDLAVAQRHRPNRLDESLDQVEPGEDFTPEEQLELTKGRAANGGLDLLPTRRFKKPSNTGSGAIPKSAPWMVLITLLSGYALWLRKEKLEIGYCGIGRPLDTIAGVQTPDWASVLLPQCEPCPQHAYCYERMVTRCEADFVLVNHPLSLAGLVPLPPTCEPDGEKARKVKVVADKAVEELRQRNADSECGTLHDEQGKSVRNPEIDEQDLKKQMAKSRRKDMSQHDFDDLWKGAIEEVVGREEVVKNNDGSFLPTAVIETSLPAPPSPESPSAAVSEDLSASRWRDIESKLQSL